MTRSQRRKIGCDNGEEPDIVCDLYGLMMHEEDWTIEMAITRLKDKPLKNGGKRKRIPTSKTLAQIMKRSPMFKARKDGLSQLAKWNNNPMAIERLGGVLNEKPTAN